MRAPSVPARDGGAGPAATLTVVRPGGGQIQSAVDQRSPERGRMGEKDTDLAVLRAAGGAGVLPLHPGLAGALLQKAGVVHDQDRTRVAKMLGHVLTHIVQNLVGVPLDPVQKPVDAVGACMARFFSQRPAVLPLQRRYQPPRIGKSGLTRL